VTSLDRWHAVHDAYVTFFGEDHRPAAVAYADKVRKSEAAEIMLLPSTFWPQRSGKVQWLFEELNYAQIQSRPLAIIRGITE
jgi:hypothetical protein